MICLFYFVNDYPKIAICILSIYPFNYFQANLCLLSALNKLNYPSFYSALLSELGLQFRGKSVASVDEHNKATQFNRAIAVPMWATTTKYTVQTQVQYRRSMARMGVV